MGTNSNRFYIGIDTGSVSVNGMVINHNKEIVFESAYQRHFGKVEENVRVLIRKLYNKFQPESIHAIAFTGNHGRTLSDKMNAFFEFETICQVLGVLHIQPDVKTIISMGGQDTALLQINHYNGGWELDYFNTNGPCASGTGSFIDQQAQRLATRMYKEEKEISHENIDTVLSDFIQLGLKSKKPANVACRCTVFTKSDMIHLQNKGEKLEDIISGLHVGNARNYISTIVSNRRLDDPIVFIGGLSLNTLQKQAFQDYFPHLVIPRYNTSLGALGVALQALELNKENRIDLEQIDTDDLTRNKVSVQAAPKLILKKTSFSETKMVPVKPGNKKIQTYLGIDIGSTTTKYALMTPDREIIHKNYVPTQGKPIEVTQMLLTELQNEVGKRIEVLGAATTGSGRNVVGDFLNVDLIIDEITAHGRGAVEIDPEVDTIFEIGGQDSKYISIAHTYPLDFDMNKVCAAGTGSFLHELANKYGINIVSEFEKIALSSDTPVKLAERCTVFMESDLVSFHQKGVKENDLMAGLCYAIVHNYLNRVVEKRPIGERVMFLGGPSLNKGVVAAFENVLNRELLVPNHREVLGAYGAAISVQEKMHVENNTTSIFRGLQRAIDDRMDYKEKVCHADPQCHNQCKLKIYDFDGRKSIWGGECGRYEVVKIKGEKKENFFEVRQALWQSYMAGVSEELPETPLMEIDQRPTIGMQKALYGHHNGILWAHFFDQLGFRLVMTPSTNTRISKAGIEAMVSETCYPIKVSHGHIKELIDKTKFLFIPTMITMPTPDASETGFYCPLVQGNSYMVQTALEINPSGVLNPVVHLKYDIHSLALEISEQIGTKLDVGKKQIKNALSFGLEQQNRFIRELQQKGDDILRNNPSDQPMVIVTGRPYNLYDDQLNLRLGRNLAKIGISGLPMDFIDDSSIDISDFPSMYWGMGTQILRTAKFIKAHPNYFGLHLTNFSCGADSFLEHFYRHIMADKAYLILELDEHSAVAGAMTRLEAYKNVIENTMQKRGATFQMDLKVAN